MLILQIPIYRVYVVIDIIYMALPCIVVQIDKTVLIFADD